ncbi:MAG: hypothetical protein HY359_15375 [Candidatus Rokubacteria bacterium]|nr:hypothetical protein [Candidatus Rokubacteria bacterium]
MAADLAPGVGLSRAVSARTELRLGLAGLAGAGVLLTGLAAAYLTARSLGWPLVHDAPLMHYIAARILEGAVPYRDLFDMNLPGVYLVHVLALGLFGRGDAAFRVLDLLVLAGAVTGLAAGLARFGRAAAAAGGALFWLYHLAGGAWRAGQRDFILCLPLAWMTAAALADAERPRRLVLGLAALGLGTAVWLKPHALLLLPVLAALAWRRPPGERSGALATVALGLALPAGPVLAWLAWLGALPAFADIVLGYLVPLYSRLGRESLVAAVRGHDLGPWVLGGLGLWALGGALALAGRDRHDARLAVLTAGVAYGALHYAVQGKGWEYQLYPLALFAIALGAAGLAAAVAAGRRALAVLLLGALALTTGSLTVKGLRNLAPAWIAAKQARVAAVVEALRPLVSAGGAVQVLDTTDGGIHALYLLGARQPTRFLYDFPFYHDVQHPYVRRLRAELLAGVRARPPAAVVLFERGWPRGDYGRLRQFPELAAWLDGRYRLAVESEGFRLYAARRDP